MERKRMNERERERKRLMSHGMREKTLMIKG